MMMMMMMMMRIPRNVEISLLLQLFIYLLTGCVLAVSVSKNLNLQNLCTAISTDSDDSIDTPEGKSSLELSKMHAARKAVTEQIFRGRLVIGIGSGSTVVYAAKFIAECIRAEKKKAEDEGEKSDLNVICIPSSFQAKQLIQENNLTLGSLDTYPQIDWTIDGADEVDSENNLIKGGGGCLTQEKILAAASKKLFIVADFTKVSSKLGTVWRKGLPIELIPNSYVNVKKSVETRFGGKAMLRMAVAKAGPIITDNGNFILDWNFPENTTNWKDIEIAITMIPGVVEVGLFLGMASQVYIGSPEGRVECVSTRKTNENDRII